MNTPEINEIYIDRFIVLVGGEVENAVLLPIMFTS